MVDLPKRSPGRPRKEENQAILETNMSESPRNDENMLKSGPVSVGLREAELRAEEIRASMRDEEFEFREYNEFYIDPREIPEGWDYEWKRETIAGQPDEENMIEMARVGWRPVDAERHKNMMASGYKGPIRRKGLILMERPLVISNKFREKEANMARQAVLDKERALGLAPQGHFERDRSKTGVRKSYEPMAIPQN